MAFQIGNFRYVKMPAKMTIPTKVSKICNKTRTAALIRVSVILSRVNNSILKMINRTKAIHSMVFSLNQMNTMKLINLFENVITNQ